MPTLKTLYPEGADLLRFLRAPVGEDRNGAMVSVRSALARLGCDPLCEAGELSQLTVPAAEKRLAALLVKFDDVPSVTGEHAAFAKALVLLLPDRRRQIPPVASRAWHSMDVTHVIGSVSIMKLMILAVILGVIASIALGLWPVVSASPVVDGAGAWQPSPVIALSEQ